MVRRIIWSEKAEKIFLKILEFYYKRNGTKTYSKKLNSEIKKLINLLKKQAFIGKITNNKSTRVLIKGDFKIFYRVEQDEIIILMVWDCRQDSEKFKL